MIYVIARGSFYYVGCQVGEACRSQMRPMYEDSVRYLLKHTSIDTEARLKEAACYYIDEALRLWSESVDFLRGLAFGANMLEEEIAVMAFAEEVSEQFPLAPVGRDKCSTLAWFTPEGKPAVLHNEDYKPYFFGKMILLDVTFVGTKYPYPRLVCVTYMGMLPGLAGSLNASGVATTNNGLWPNVQPGLPKQVLHFRAALARRISEAEHWLALQPNSLTTHYTVTDGREVISLGVSNVKTATTDMRVRRITDAFCHTNHIPADDQYLRLLQSDPVESVPEASHTFARYEKLRGIIASGQLPTTPQQALDLFSTNDGLIHRTPEQHPSSVTLATIFIHDGKFWVRDANPLVKPYERDRVLVVD